MLLYLLILILPHTTDRARISRTLTIEKRTPTGRSEDRPEIAVAFHLTGKPHATIQLFTFSLDSFSH